MNGCWFHYTKPIWPKVQKLGIAQSFHENIELTRLIKQLMAIPSLSARPGVCNLLPSALCAAAPEAILNTALMRPES